jgi:carbon-monoxide dehydrogenase small subunit
VKREMSVTVNGEHLSSTVEHRMLLVDFLREIAGLTGTHVGCGYEGRCGACTVIVNGVAVKSCLMFAVQADGAQVLTNEGLARDGELHPLQAAFHDQHGLQCGFCTPGFLMTLYDFAQQGDRTEDGIRKALSGVLCRCTGYVHIVAAAKQALAALDEMSPAERAKWFPV